MKILKILKNIFAKPTWSCAVRAVACATVLAVTFSICGFDARCDEIRENVLRLHVIANSDSEEDQRLKLYVRDAVLGISADVFEGCADETEAAAAAEENLAWIRETAQNAVAECGYSYPVFVEVADTWFDTRAYDDFTLPAGTYEALRVVIGNGEGHNWWCVMFPAVCLPAAGNSDFSDVLDERETEMVTQPQKYVARFKVVEVYETVKEKLSKWF